MPYIKLNLAGIIDELGITKNKLAVESKVRPNTITDLVNANAKAVNFETLVKVLATLNQIAEEKGYEKRYQVADIFEYVEEDAS